MILALIQNNFRMLANADLLAVGVVVATAMTLGYIVCAFDSKSATRRSFLLFLIITVCYSVANYLHYHTNSVGLALWFLRIVMFFAIWHAFMFFRLFYVFPREQAEFPKWYRVILVPMTGIVSLVALTPLLFSRVSEISVDGRILKIMNGPGIAPFTVLIIGLFAGGFLVLIRKMMLASGVERMQFRFVFFGTVVTFSLLLVMNFLLPAFLDNARFVPFAPVFLLPFIGFMFYAIQRYHLLNTKIISSEILTLVLSIALLVEVIFTAEPLTLIFRFSVFILVLLFGILLTRSVRKEVEQRIELERVTGELQKINAKLENVNRFKSQLLSLASHQIKSPLAAIKGFAEILLEGLYGPVEGKVRETLEKMKQSADALVKMINMLLDLRKVEEGKMEYHFARINLAELVGRVVEDVRPLALQKNIDITFQKLCDGIWVQADAQKLILSVQNLIDNAIKYTDVGSVRVTVEAKEESALLRVSDSGIGIPQEIISTIFDEFTRSERARQSYAGTGLGLYIAKKIVEAHGGRVWAESEGANKGSVFSIALKKII